MCGGRVILKLCHFERSSPVKRDLTVCHFERSGRSFSFVRAAPRPHPCHFERSGRSFSFVRAARTTGHAARNLSSAFCSADRPLQRCQSGRRYRISLPSDTTLTSWLAFDKRENRLSHGTKIVQGGSTCSQITGVAFLS